MSTSELLDAVRHLPDQVRDEVRRVIDVLAPGGGYMVSSVHTIMNGVPAENILAMVDAVVDYGSAA